MLCTIVLGAIFAVLVVSAGAKEKSSKSDKHSKSDKYSKSERSSEKSGSKSEKSSRSDRESAPPAPMPGGISGQGYGAYRYVQSRNIFDPTRRGMRMETTAPASVSSSSMRRGRALALTGTMVTEGRSLAFFGGAENRVIGVGESVANFKVTQITPAQVSLEHEGRALQLEVGRQIALEGSAGEPLDGPPIVEPAASEAAPPAPGMPPPPTSGGDKNETLRRMMERRAAEMGK